MIDQERTALLRARFAELYDGEPEVWVQAPGRVDLMGSHTDYNLGYVLTLPIDRSTWIAARPRADRTVTIYSLNVEGGAAFSLDAIEHSGTVSWTNFVRGVAKIFEDEGYGLCGFDGLVHSTVPMSSGLSSSAALEVATATLFEAMCGVALTPVQTAVLCQRAENSFVGVNCGILDQYTSAAGQAGHALLLDCRDLTHQSAAVHDSIRIVICDTRAKRELTGSEYPQRRAQCEAGAARLAEFYPGVQALRDVTLQQLLAHAADLPEVVFRRCRFIVEENQRVLDLAEALPANDRARIATLAGASFAGARDLYEICSPEMLAMMDAMRSGPGIIGARQAGAGFGGCMVAFVDAGAIDPFAQHVSSAYQAATGIKPTIYPVQAAPGAGILAVV